MAKVQPGPPYARKQMRSIMRLFRFCEVIMGLTFLLIIQMLIFPGHGLSLSLHYVWWLMAISGCIVLPAMFLGLRISYKHNDRLYKTNKTICLDCGYSLEGLDDSGQCPECGCDYEIQNVQDTWRGYD